MKGLDLMGNETFNDRMTINPNIRRALSTHNIVLVLIGTLGNCLTLRVTSSRQYQKSSFTIYLAALAVVDIAVLWLWPFKNWIYDMFEIELETLGTTLCKLVNFLTYLAQHTTSWFVVALAAERFYCIYFPFKTRRQMFNQKTGLVVVAIIMAVLVCVDSHLLYGLTLFEDGNETVCDLIDDHNADFFNLYFAWIDISVLFLVPATLIVIFNVAVVYKTQTSGKSVKSSSSSVSRKLNRHVRVITTVICIAFIVLLGPLGVFVTIKPYIFPNNSSFYKPVQKQEMVFDFFASLLAQLNHCVNFYLYILTGSRFRQLLRDSFCGAPASATSGATSTQKAGSTSSSKGHSPKPSTSSQ